MQFELRESAGGQLCLSILINGKAAFGTCINANALQEENARDGKGIDELLSFIRLHRDKDDPPATEILTSLLPERYVLEQAEAMILGKKGPLG
jgi:hypothetical protein